MANNNYEYAQVLENYDTLDMISPKSVDDGIGKVVLFKYNWTMNFSQVKSVSEELNSPEFPKRANSAVTWYLTIPWTTYDRVKVKLTLATCNVQELNVNFKFKATNSNGSVFANWTNAHNKSFNQEMRSSDPIQLYLGNYYGHPNEYIVVIVCEITVPASQVYHQDIPRNSPIPMFQYSKELHTIFENEKFSDITFSINGKELQAHKVILAAGSSVFMAMFEHNMMEKKNSRVEITDIKFEVLREMINFIYTGKVSNLEQVAKELLVASDKYELVTLKDICESMLCKNVSTENVAEMFIFADTYNANLLKDDAKKYIVGHPNDVSDTSGWKSMILTHPLLLAEAFIALANK